MKMCKKILILIIILLQTNSKIHQVVSIFRHGARYYASKYYDWNDTFWGQLSAVGMRQHQKLGEMLRRDYTDRHILSDEFNQKQVQIYTTDMNRTYISALSQLYGLYPLGKGPRLPQVDTQYHLPPYQYKADASEQQFALPKGYQPIPVTVNESVLLPDCPRALVEIQKNQNAQMQKYKEMNLTYFPFIKKMTDIFNLTSVNFQVLFLLHDALVVDKYLGKPMPPDFTEDDYLNLKHLATWYGLFEMKFDLLKAYNTGPIKRIIEDFDDRINNINTKTLRWTALSAHDTNINALMNSLNISSDSCIQDLYRKNKTTALNCEQRPEFAASLIFELQSDNDKDFFVKIRYNGKYVYLCQKKSISCLYQEWKNRIRTVITERAYQICYGMKGEQNQNEKIETDPI